VFSNSELITIIDLCERVEEEYGRTRKKEDRLLSYNIAKKANLALGENAKSLQLLEWNLSDIL